MRQMSTRPNQPIRASLLWKGMTLTEWATMNGFKPRTLSQVLWRYGGKNDRPQTGQALAMIEALEAETGIKICG